MPEPAAADYAAAGYVVEGFLELTCGMERAETAAADGEEWGPELVTAYRSSLDRYTERYGAKLLE